MSERRRFSPKLLAAELDRREISNREFGKRVRPTNPEGGRTSLIDHLKGRYVPQPATIKRYADALGVGVDALTVPEPPPESATRVHELRAKQDARRVAQEAA